MRMREIINVIETELLEAARLAGGPYGEMPVFRVRSKKQLEGLLARFGAVRLLLEPDGLYGWDASEMTHDDYKTATGTEGANLSVTSDGNVYDIGISTGDLPHATSPAILNKNRFFQNVFGNVERRFIDHETWDEI